MRAGKQPRILRRVAPQDDSAREGGVLGVAVRLACRHIHFAASIAGRDRSPWVGVEHANSGSDGSPEPLFSRTPRLPGASSWGPSTPRLRRSAQGDAIFPKGSQRPRGGRGSGEPRPRVGAARYG